MFASRQQTASLRAHINLILTAIVPLKAAEIKDAAQAVT